VALAQLIDDINFRILTYLEQQQYPDIRVRQAITSTFAKYVGCLEDIYVRLNVSRSTTIRPFFHNQHDELHLLIHFLKHPFILHDLNNLQLLLDFNNLIFS
ncbi:unnamed protein product, partial [Rotaria sp. Silwood2]